MKIALIGVTHPFRGGIAHYTTLLCRALRTRHEVRFFALSRQYPSLLFPGKTQLDASADSLAVEHEASLDSINPWTWWTTARRIARWRADLVLFSWWHPFFAPSFGTVARLARWMGRVPSCYLCHNAIPHERTALDMLLLRYAFASGQAFIAHSQEDAANLKQLRRVAVVHYNPHPTYVVFAPGEAPSIEEAKRRLGLEGRRVLLFFGFVRGYKGLAHLLDAVALLDPSYHLLVVGEFYDDRAAYEPRLARLAERGQVTVVDRYVPNEEVGRYFLASDLVMVPYLSATQSGVIQMAYGFLRPVVATAVGGIPEVVIEGKTGYLVPPADPQAMAEAVRRYFVEDRTEEFRAHIARENANYTWERMLETIEAAWRGLSGRT
jgi:glycosyltransferase involved in cell wall biosynthesis